MHQEFRLSDQQTVFYRYNPQADVLAVRFKSDFKAAEERPLPSNPAVSVSHDLDDGAALGLRISGVQQMILQSLIRDAFALAAPALGLPTPTVAGALRADEPASRPAAQPVPTVQPVAQPAPTVQPVAQPAPTVQPVAQPAPIVQPVAQPAPIAQPVAQPAPAAQPVAQPTPMAQPVAAQPVAQPTGRTDPSSVAWQPTTGPASTTAVDVNAAGDDDDAFDTDDAPDEGGNVSEPRRRRRRRRRRPVHGAGGHQAAADGDDVLVSIAPMRSNLPLADAASALTEASSRPLPVAGLPNPPETPILYPPQGQPAVVEVASEPLPSLADLPRSYSAVPEMAHSVRADGDGIGEPDTDPDVVTSVEQDAEAERRRRRRRRGRRGAEGATDVAAAFPVDDDGDALPGDPEAEAHWDDEGRPCPETFAPLRLHPRVAHAISDLGFSSPTPIQVEAIPVALSGEDLVGLAQTGTGKTLAFVAPSLTRLLSGDRPGNRPRMVILTPTRELAIQVALEAERLAAHTDLRVATIYGGVSMGQQTDDLRRGVDVVVATPGRILDHLRRRNVQLDAVEVLVLDEADRMLDMGFLPDVRAIIRQLPGQRQTMLFTATFPPEIESLSLEFQHKPRTVEIARRKPPESIDQRLYPVGRHLKAPLLVHLLETDPTMDRVLIFTERKIDADVLARKLRQDGISVALMHGDRTQVEREQALAALKSRKVRVLVATNVAARGLDIEEISHVVNYDVPQSIDEYVHRIGRTARAESEGKAYSFITMGDEAMVSRIEAALGRQLPRVQAPGFDYDVTPPSWAKLSGNDVLALLNKETSTVDRLRSLSRRRR